MEVYNSASTDCCECPHVSEREFLSVCQAQCENAILQVMEGGGAVAAGGGNGLVGRVVWRGRDMFTYFLCGTAWYFICIVHILYITFQVFKLLICK